jgi:hypothetical protein
MKILNNDQNTEAWQQDRLGKITGSKLKDLVVKRGTGKKIGFYQLIADKLSVPDNYDDAMERGHALESEAIALFEKEKKVKVEQVGLCISDFNDEIALSPDGLIQVDGNYTQAVEIKCLSSARHLQAYFQQAIPNEYMEQVLQYFIVNDDLETLHFVFYDPRLPESVQLHYQEVHRDDIQEKADQLKEYQINLLQEVDELVSKIMF